MADIRYFIKSHLLEPLKNYPTIIQDTMIEIITQKLQRLYDYAVKFPEIVSPTQSRLDILQAISDQFLFTVREDADIQEQINILDNILYVYSRRGSVDTIENMWKYYGGTLPKDVKVVIPSYNLFRYNLSRLSGTHKFANGSPNYVILDTNSPTEIPRGTLLRVEGSDRYRVTSGIINNSYQVFISTVDGLSVGDRLFIGEYYSGIIQSIYDNSKADINRPGIYEIRLTNNTYPIPDLREFLLKELVAAGNLIYFTNELNMNLINSEGSDDAYLYNIYEDTLVNIEIPVLKSHQGLTWSGNNPISPNPSIQIYDPTKFSRDEINRLTMSREFNKSLYSGRGSIFLELTLLMDPIMIDEGIKYSDSYRTYEDLGFNLDLAPFLGNISYSYDVDDSRKRYDIFIGDYLYCTPEDPASGVERYLSSDDGEYLYEDDRWTLVQFGPYPGYFILGESLLGQEIS